MKKYLLIILLFIMGVFVPIEVFASGGALRADSIVSCDGVYYGKHGDGHWHVAEKKSGKWYPQDSAIYMSNNPCGKTTTKKPTTTTKSTIKIASITTKKITTTSKVTSEVKSTTTLVEPTTTSETITKESKNTSLVIENDEQMVQENEDDNNSDDGVGAFIGLWLASAVGVTGYQIVKDKKK